MSASLLARLFPDGAGTTTCPWPRAGRRKSVRDVDPQVVAQLLARAPGEDLEWIDPAELRSTQPSITRAGVAYYLGSDYFRTGTTYADMHSAANRVPVVYRRDDGQSLILTGHHRSSAALLQGEPLLARVGYGGWGPPRAAVVPRNVARPAPARRPLHVTPGLVIGPDGDPADTALRRILAGERVAVPDDETARQVLAHFGCPGPADRLGFARTGRVLRTGD